MRHVVAAAMLSLAATSPALAAWPISLAGTGVETDSGIAGDLALSLKRNGSGTLTVTAMGVSGSLPIHWRIDPATGQLGWTTAGGGLFIGTIAGTCSTGHGSMPAPSMLALFVGPTLDVDYTVCVVP